MTLQSLRNESINMDTVSGIRRSLFPNVPPYIRFTNGRFKGKPLPRNIRRLLRWQWTKCTPNVVRSVVCQSGFLVVDKCKCWSGTWDVQMRKSAYMKLHDHQKFNHLPNTYHVGRKDDLWRNIQLMKSKFGEQTFDMMPTTFVLPQDKRPFRLECFNKKHQRWILKPPACYRGDGIRVVHKYSLVPKKMPLIVQNYVHNPYLINGSKFDLRIYALLTSVNPLKLYLYKEGLVRFATKKYNPGTDCLQDKFIHLTNYSVNRLNEQYETNSDTGACKGHKWTLTTLWKYLRKKEVDVGELWKSLVDLVIKTFVAAEDALCEASEGFLKTRYNGYELFGIDILLDNNLKLWLLEVNTSPSLQSSSKLDKEVKSCLVRDTFNLVGFNIPVSKKLTNEQLLTELRGNIDFNDSLTIISFDSRLYLREVANDEKRKQSHFTNNCKNRAEYLNKILTSLTADDVRNLILFEDEQQDQGRYQKIFPTSETHRYLKYFSKPRYYNLLLDAWETKYHTNREKGRELLRKLCLEGFHLKLSPASELH